MSNQLANSTPVFILSNFFAIFPYQIQFYRCNLYYFHFLVVFIIISYWAIGISPSEINTNNGLHFKSNILRLSQGIDLSIFFGTAILCFVISFFRKKNILETMNLLAEIDLGMKEIKWEKLLVLILIFRYFTMTGLTLWWSYARNFMRWIAGTFICEFFDMCTLLILSQYIVGLLVVNGMFKQINMVLKNCLNKQAVVNANGNAVPQFQDLGMYSFKLFELHAYCLCSAFVYAQ